MDFPESECVYVKDVCGQLTQTRLFHIKNYRKIKITFQQTTGTHSFELQNFQNIQNLSVQVIPPPPKKKKHDVSFF